LRSFLSAHFLAVQNGIDVDNPRNLVKAVVAEWQVTDLLEDDALADVAEPVPKRNGKRATSARPLIYLSLEDSPVRVGRQPLHQWDGSLSIIDADFPPA
jgi:hypothetical protein